MAIPIYSSELETAISQVRNTFSSVKRESNSIILECQSGSIKLGSLLTSRLTAFKNFNDSIEALKGTAGLGIRYSKLYPNETFSLGSDVAALQTAIGNLLSFIKTNLPKTGNYVAVLEVADDFTVSQRTVTNAGVISQLQALAQAIADLINDGS